MSVLDHLICPIDKQPLSLNGNSLVCADGHSFDRAKSGYVNLLPVQHKHSRDPGDSKAMVAARKAFLNGGHYAPISDAIAAGYHALRPGPATVAVFDAGCGEGYYLDRLQRQLIAAGYSAACQGLDISKWAVQAASKRSQTIGWMVGSNAAIPAPAARFDLLTCLFGFPVFGEFARVLKPDGLLLLVEAGADHLIELRRILYPRIHPYSDSHGQGIAGFEPVREQPVQFTFELDSATAIQDLLAMTPHLHKASYEGRQAAQQLERISLTADVKLRWYRNA